MHAIGYVTTSSCADCLETYLIIMADDMVRCDDRHLWTVLDTSDMAVKVKTAAQLVADGVDRYRVPTLADGKRGWAKITEASEIPVEDLGSVSIYSGCTAKGSVHDAGAMTAMPSVRCIEVDDPTHLYQLASPDGVLSHNTGGGKSVAQRSVVFHCIAHSSAIKFLGIDLKRVELSAYKPFSNAVIGIATTLEDALEVLHFAQETMMDRYGEMERAQKNNFLDMRNAGSALLVMVDEAGELLDTSSPAKALAGSTFVPTLEGRPDLAHVRKGDFVIGEDGEWHEVLDKYEPAAQDHYSVTVERDSDGAVETIEAGAEHLWRVYLPQDLSLALPMGVDVDREPDGLVSAVVTTEALKQLRDSIPVERRSEIKFKRSAIDPAVVNQVKSIYGEDSLR